MLVSCKKTDKKSADILSHDQMVKGLVGIYIAEQKLNLGLDADSAKKVFNKIEGRVFKDIGIPDSTFKRSFDYYMDKPKEFQLIYTAVVDTLNLYEQRANTTK